MERTVTEHEVKGEHQLIRVITKTYVTIDGKEKLWNNHRAPQHVPGTLEEDTYVKTPMSELSATVKVLAGHFWTEEVHASYETVLKARKEANNLI